MSHPATEIAEYKKRIAALERQLEKENRKLLSLPAKMGFKSMGELINALESAAKKGGASYTSSGISRRTRAKITPEIKAKVKTLAKDGKTGKEIAAALSISVPSVQNIKRELGLVKARNPKKHAK